MQNGRRPHVLRLSAALERFEAGLVTATKRTDRPARLDGDRPGHPIGMRLAVPLDKTSAPEGSVSTRRAKRFVGKL